ncbi:MAG: gluconate 2-dehydrogenase subunit 3 family protein [Opitutaceae bacterium]|jgi:hypothetical protein
MTVSIHTPPSPEEILKTRVDSLLEALIPGDVARGLPCATDVGVCQYIRAKGHEEEARQLIDALEAIAEERFGTRFDKLELASRSEIVGKLPLQLVPLMNNVGMDVIQCYYQDPRVLKALGLRGTAPFPDGYQVPAGDLMLLEPVFVRGKLYREVNK